MNKIQISYDRALDFISEDEIFRMQDEMNIHHRSLLNKTGKGNDFLGWVEIPGSIDHSLINRINEDAHKIRSASDLMVVVGIGGSYLGARAVIEALGDPFASLNHDAGLQVVYAGHHLSEDYHNALLKLLDGRDYSLVVISKSGTTTEPAIAFRLLKAHMEKKYGRDGASERIYAVTDHSKGALRSLADKEGYSTYVIPDDVGGRYSVLTPVGLLPIAAAGFSIASLMKGAREMQDVLMASPNLNNNPAALYAALRNLLYRKNFQTEILVNYEPSLFYITEWWKQLYGESEGKDGKGIFPAGVSFTTDLHSLGQYIQEGRRMFFETVLHFESPASRLTVPADPSDLDKLNFLEGRRLSDINTMARLGTMLAHVDGGVPNLGISFEKNDEENIGALIYFFEFACSLSGYVLDVNPFDQPGVEAYKKNMFALLGKPGFEEQTRLLRSRLDYHLPGQ